MITDEELLLYYYRDGLDAADRARIGAALGEQPDLAQRLHRLVARLDAAAAQPEVPVPEHVRQRWAAALERAARNETTRAAPPRRRFFAHRHWQAAAAAVAIIAIVATLQLTMRPSPDRVPGEAAPVWPEPLASTHDAAYERGLRWHLASTEQQLAKLGGATPDQRARLIETIIAQNRMYALAAERAGEPQLARVLRAFAPVLESVVRDAGEPSPSSIARLSFELRVLQARLSAEADKSTSAQPVAL